MVRIRLRRVGAKGQPSYRIVVADQRSPRDGRFIEILGHYNPRTEPETVAVDADRAAYWLDKGAQPSEAVERLLKKAGAYEALAALRGTPAEGPAEETPVSAPVATTEDVTS
ncbi:MAG TPA: 30S ribosomal protein S16 [Chloroflexi bacterium]|nr:30S ribosomal protein S16 [Chloroflexota bacterium]